MIAKITGFILLSVTLGACSSKYTAYTSSLDRSLAYTERQLTKVQFYLDDDLRLFKEASDNKVVLDRGTIYVDSGREVDEVLIKEGTPGQVVDRLTGNRLAVSFDDDPNSYLLFGPSKKYGGKYVLLAKDWDREVGRLDYGGRPYRVSVSSNRTGLMVDLRKSSKVSKQSSAASGRRVN
jgi:hypothetical protein